jgi:predicted dehydrogenase
MTSRLSRRSFLRQAALATGAMAAPCLLPNPSPIQAAGPEPRVSCAVIGCGGRGMSHLAAAAPENLVAVVDADEKRLAAAQAWLQDKGHDPDKVATFTDYRRMFDRLGKQLDAVFIATPNHHHALPALIAMQLGKGVYCEKPLCHDVAEARRLADEARRSRVATQMGNQGHCEEGYRRLCEYVWAGVIGRVTETHSWTDRANGGSGPRPPSEPVPAGLHWDEWLGPAPSRSFHADLHPHEWHGWYDFGNGSLGNMACHVLDGVFWALKLEHPTGIEVEEMVGGSDERYPTGTRIRWDFPARGDMPAVKVYWYDGHPSPDASGGARKGGKGTKGAHNVPPLLEELKQKYPDETFDSNGTLYVGDKGILYTGTYGGGMRLVPAARMREVTGPPKSLPRPRGSFADFLRACREGKADTATPFEYGARLTEFTLLGNLAQHAGVGQKVNWDGPNMRVVNLPDLNQWVKREPRKGWQA